MTEDEEFQLLEAKLKRKEENDMNIKQLRKGRGKSAIPAKVGTSIRLDPEVLEYYRTNYPNTMQAVMRKVLKDHVEKSTSTQLELFP